MGGLLIVLIVIPTLLWADLTNDSCGLQWCLPAHLPPSDSPTTTRKWSTAAIWINREG
jgi:hypothetical protein